MKLDSIQSFKQSCRCFRILAWRFWAKFLRFYPNFSNNLPLWAFLMILLESVQSIRLAFVKSISKTDRTNGFNNWTASSIKYNRFFDWFSYAPLMISWRTMGIKTWQHHSRNNLVNLLLMFFNWLKLGSDLQDERLALSFLRVVLCIKYDVDTIRFSVFKVINFASILLVFFSPGA